jgi:hypothetical protein
MSPCIQFWCASVLSKCLNFAILLNLYYLSLCCDFAFILFTRCEHVTNAYHNCCCYNRRNDSWLCNETFCEIVYLLVVSSLCFPFCRVLVTSVICSWLF